MVLCLRHLLCKHEDPSLDSPEPCECQGGVAAHLWHSNLRRQSQWIPRTSGLARLAILMSWEVKGPTSRNKVEDGPMMIPRINFIPSHVCAPSHFHTHSHTGKCAYIYEHYTYTKKNKLQIVLHNLFISLFQNTLMGFNYHV